jgi:hypothetical protein
MLFEAKLAHIEKHDPEIEKAMGKNVYCQNATPYMKSFLQ